MNKRFPLLSFISVALSWLGWILLVLGGLRFTLSAIALFIGAGGGSVTALLVGGGVVLAGLSAIGAGESIKVFFAIEANTRSAADSLAEIVDSGRKADEAARQRKT